jgi:3-hydroxyacyl-CoA dehydrogenase
MSEIQAGCARFPGRCLIAHPFNPPHLMPLVEIVGGKDTDAAVLDAVQGFYEALGKKCVRLNKELPGHVANRIAFALYREVAWLIEHDYVSVGDVDRAVSWGPGLRWGILGPNALYQLGGGEGGAEHFFAQLGPSLQDYWSSAGNPELTPALRLKIVEGIRAAMGSMSNESLARERDRLLLELVALREESPGVISA